MGVKLPKLVVIEQKRIIAAALSFIFAHHHPLSRLPRQRQAQGRSRHRQPCRRQPVVRPIETLLKAVRSAAPERLSKLITCLHKLGARNTAELVRTANQ